MTTQGHSDTKPYRTVFVVELEQTTGLSSGGRDGALYADAIMARDGAGRFILRGSGLAGALLATLDDFDVAIPSAVSARLPENGKQSEKYESLWLLHHAHLLDEAPTAEVRPNVAIHAWTGAAADGLKFDTETLPRGTRWRFLVETDDWRDQHYGTERGAAQLLALALREWQQGRCWLGRSPARGLGWMRLTTAHVFQLDNAAAGDWPSAEVKGSDTLEHLRALPGCTAIAMDTLTKATPKRRSQWRMFTGTITVGEREDGYGLDSLSTLSRDFPPDEADYEAFCKQDAWAPFDGEQLTAKIKPDSFPAWTHSMCNGQRKFEFIVPGSAIRGALRSQLSALWRRAGDPVWAPNGLPESQPIDIDADPLLPLFGSIDRDSALLVSDAYPAPGSEPEFYVQEQHAEDEFTQSTYASAKFNRPCLISGTFRFHMAIREALADDAPGLQGKAASIADQVVSTIDALGQARSLALGGGIWRGHGWVTLAVQAEKDDGMADDSGISQTEEVPA